MRRIGWSWGLLLLGAAIAGCGRQSGLPPAPKSPEVVVCQPVVREVTDYEPFPGTIVAVADVTVRARVSGYLDKVLFREGAEVKEGDPLFDIDPRIYQADLEQKEANVALCEAHLNRSESDYKRASELLKSNSISETDYDQYRDTRDEAVATLKMAKAARDLSQLNVTFTHVTAPISGRISRQLVDPGNLVTADQTPLTTIVSQDPVYAEFKPDMRTVLRIRRLIRAGTVKSSMEEEMPVFLELPDEEGFPHRGSIHFVDNRVDTMTGTLYLRGRFPNPQRMLSPGLFARIQLPIGKPHASLAIAEKALGTDQGQKYLYVVDKDNKVAYRSVKVGRKLGDGLQAIEEGLKEGEQVVLDGVQRVRPGITVAPKMAEALSAADSSKRSAGKRSEAAIAEKPGPSAGGPPSSAAAPEPVPAAIPPAATKADAAVSNRPSS